MGGYMEILSLKLENYNYSLSELKKYLESLKGISKVTINENENIIDVYYYKKDITLNIIKKEIYLFLDITKTPSLLSFTKSTKCNYSKFDYVIKEVCCEYWFMSMIDDFFDEEGIVSIESNYEISKYKDICLHISYIDKLIGKEKIINIINS